MLMYQGETETCYWVISSWLKHNQEMVIKAIKGITHKLWKHAQCHTQWNNGLCVFIQSWFSDYDKIISLPVYTGYNFGSKYVNLHDNSYMYRNLSFLSHQQFPFHSCFDFRPTTYIHPLDFVTWLQCNYIMSNSDDECLAEDPELAAMFTGTHSLMQQNILGLQFFKPLHLDGRFINNWTQKTDLPGGLVNDPSSLDLEHIILLHSSQQLDLSQPLILEGLLELQHVAFQRL